MRKEGRRVGEWTDRWIGWDNGEGGDGGEPVDLAGRYIKSLITISASNEINLPNNRYSRGLLFTYIY